MKINYNGRWFRSKFNQANGQVDSNTTFHYHQKDHYIWGNYQGGEIKAGVLLGFCSESGELHFNYQHIDEDHQFRTGVCHSKPDLDEDGNLILIENWQWTNGNLSTGPSIVEEIKNKIWKDF